MNAPREGLGTTPDERPPRRRGATAALFAAIAASVGCVSLAGPLAERTVVLELVWAAGSVAWLAAVATGGRGAGLRGILVGALVLRALAWAGDPELSDDVYRYVWEGGLVARGESPYADPPDAPRWASRREAWPEVHRRLNHPSVSAAYPPLAQLANAGVVAAAGGPAEAGRAKLALRVFYGLCDLACLAPLVWLARRRGDGGTGGRRAAVVWGWSPLVALEFAGSAHLDSLGVLLLLGGLVAFERSGAASRWSPLGALCLTAGALVKLLPAVLLPFATRARAGDAGAVPVVRRVALVAAAFALAWVPFALRGGGLVAGLSEYGLRWESANLVFRGIEAPFGAFLERDGSWSDPRRLARGAAALLWLVVAWREWRRPADLARTAGVLVGAFLVLSPTLHPWYLAWMLPFAALGRSRAWLALAALAPLAYWPLAGWHADGVWEEPAWLWPVLALPFLALGATDVLARRGDARA